MGVYKKVAGIYVISNLENNKKYVGHSRNIRKRWDTHKHNLRRNQSKQSHLQRSWNKYGENSFVFSIVEEMPLNLTMQQYEEVETKWVLHYKSHLKEYGYNSVLPGSIPLIEEDENVTKKHRGEVKYVCMHKGGEKLLLSHYDVVHTLNIPSSKVMDLANYWRGKSKRMSLKGWMVIRESEYDENVDYLHFRKERKKRRLKVYTEEELAKKNIPPKPYEERNLKRIPIIAIDVITGKETYYRTMKDSTKDFMLDKVRKCLRYEFGKYKHRGHWFKRA